MPAVIAAINGKGGAGKTTALMNIAGEYALRGRSVGLLDIDPRSNLMKWWGDCHDKGNQAEGLDVFSLKTGKAIAAFFESKANVFDYVLVDTPGEDTSIIDGVIARTDLVISPVQPSKREVVGAIECLEVVRRVNKTYGAACRHGVLKTRITLPVCHTELYRKIRPIIVEHAGTYLFKTEVHERNVYKDIHSGLGTLQMQAVTPAIAKARRETLALVEEIDSLLSGEKGSSVEAG
ncbi:ParA family protein [Mesorhizobium captivum]|uniref:ParA family protein n=1 Tax=Mesorhizobium captivum TaxID=3072319 RepID=UPI002A23F4FB|nr:ParA family protein [Mesorhizobium sp. VK3C]MDX8449372.1 ParA family protein [Mesorhizobium sp. VK3C]